MINDKFINFKNGIDVFVETGTFHGEGVMNAINSGFKKIYSVEIYEPLWEENINRFKDNENVKIIFGDSSKILYKVLSEINEPILFWLDGHHCGENTGQSDELQWHEFPLLAELNQIKMHNIRNHTILIDDLRCIPSIEKQSELNFKTRYTVDTIKEHILAINENYTFSYANGFIQNDILVAQVK